MEWLVVMTAAAANVVMVQVTAAMVVVTMVVVTETYLPKNVHEELCDGR